MKKVKVRLTFMTKKNLKLIASAFLPTIFGKFKIYLFKDKFDNKEHLALVKGNLNKKTSVFVRIHSECITGDVFHSLKCDCHFQLVKALEIIGKEKNGILIYLRQEGRGIGLENKIKAYALQDKGLDTVEANLKLGFPADLRTYDIAVAILKYFKIKSIKLITNNPEKIESIEKEEIKIIERIPILVGKNKYNENYLLVKKRKLNHILDI
jgi:GTP cyclohydrolase II